MTSSIYGPSWPETERSTRTSFFTKFVLVIAVFGLDFLLWPAQFGIAVAMTLASLFGLKLFALYQITPRRTQLFASIVLLVGILPLVEVVNPLTVLLGGTFTYAACFALSNVSEESWTDRLDRLISSTLGAPFRFPKLCLGLRKFGVGQSAKHSFLNWLAPLALCGVFVVLFAYASPIWQSWLEAIDLIKLIEVLFSPRLVFWFFVACFAWPFLEHRVSKLRVFRLMGQGFSFAFPAKATVAKETNWAPFVQRCLVLFNLVFATQNILDFSILWGGAELPEGMTYAEYAHRGAYPLVVAALLAAAFILLAMRPGGLGERFVLIRNLVLLWVGQNILLLASSLLRLDIYINFYALTYWRIAAFIWMLLVAAGLVLIIARFVLKRSAGWLVIANVVVLISTLYVTSFVNLPFQITKFNLEHSDMARESGSRLDLSYVRILGPHALPAFEDMEKKLKRATPVQIYQLRREQRSLEARYLRDHFRLSADWRAWTYREHRLTDYVEQQKKRKRSADAAERETP